MRKRRAGPRKRAAPAAAGHHQVIAAGAGEAGFREAIVGISTQETPAPTTKATTDDHRTWSHDPAALRASRSTTWIATASTSSRP
jgi:hypothetical protein